MDDEYIDYSCSTALERLSRDVETLLRSWHIVQGSDRHVSFHDGHRAAASKSSTAALLTSTSTSTSTHTNYNSTSTITPARSSTRTNKASVGTGTGTRGARIGGGVASPPSFTTRKLNTIMSTPSTSTSTAGSTPDPRTPPRHRSLVEQQRDFNLGIGNGNGGNEIMDITHSYGGDNTSNNPKTPKRNLNSILALKSCPRDTPPRTPNTYHKNANNTLRTTTTPLKKSSSKVLLSSKPKSKMIMTSLSQQPPPSPDFHTPPRNTKDLYKLEDANARNHTDIKLIRSGKVVFTTAPPNSTCLHKDRVSIELELCLWDGPPQSSSSSSSSSSFNGGENVFGSGFFFDNQNRQHGHYRSRHAANLPLSLTSNSQDPFPTVNILSNLSYLLGIGQHLTLSPASKGDIDTFLTATKEALERASHPSSNVHRGKFLRLSSFVGFSSSRGEDDVVALHTGALYSLSHQLQTALNLAVANCDCRLPAFGIWGLYGSNNNKKLKSSSSLAALDSSGGSGSGSGGVGGEKGGLGNNEANESSTLTQSVMEVPAWMNAGDLFNVASKSSVCCMFRKYMEDMRNMSEQQDEESADEDEYDYGSSDSDSAYADDYSYSEDKVMTPSRQGFLLSPKNTPLRKGNSAKKTKRSKPRIKLPPTPFRNKSASASANSNKQRKELYLPAFLMGRCHAGSSFLGSGAEFAIHVVPPGVEYPIHCTTLNSLGQMLLQHCPLPLAKIGRHRHHTRRHSKHSTYDNRESLTAIHGKVAVTGARHKYAWSKIFQFREDFIPRQDELLLTSPRSTRYKTCWDELNMSTYGLSWKRNAGNDKFEAGGDNDEDGRIAATKRYRAQCRAQALKILYQFSCLAKTKSSKRSIVAKRGLEPLCGPTEDPISLLSVHVTWSSDNRLSEGDAKTPLLTLPLRIRSQNEMSSQDVLEMENTLLSTIFNPNAVRAKDFQISATYDPDAPCTTLSATNRCLLASLIRVCTLGQSYLLGHLTKSSILEELHERDELDLVADEIMNEANVSHVTRSLVEVLDWGNMADMMEDDAASNDSRFHEIVEQILGESSEIGQYPSPPEEMTDGSDKIDRRFQSHLKKACRPGQLLSVLCTSMASLQTPSSMASLWMIFVQTLRMKWERRESLPSLDSVPGLEVENAGDRTSLFELRKKKSQFSSSGIGSKAKNAAFVNSSEKDPDIDDCLINQKLQVFNIGVEAMIFAEMKKLQKKQFEIERMNAIVRNEAGSNSYLGDESLHLPQTLDSKLGKMSEDFDDTQQDTDDDTVGGDTCDYRSCITREEFFDAVGTMKDNDTSRNSDDSITYDNEGAGGEYIDDEEAVQPGQRQRRQGARCPIASSGGQIFAPYLQRDVPMTTDLVIERRKMLSKTGYDNCSIQSRIEAAHRLQRRKLLNDMSAFKAANPGSMFQDFINWYGNPDNPLDQYEDEDFNSNNTSFSSLASPSRNPEDEAMEAVFVLNATREFWGDCWNESQPRPAVDQEPLFDAFGTVEMLLLWFETMHPALLINQVLAVNLATANFILQSSAPSANIRPVNDALKRLERKTEISLRLLSKDVTRIISSCAKSAGSESDILDPFTYVTPETITACERVCSAIGETETIISRATSLLTKLNGDEELVQGILEAPEGRNMEALSSKSRTGILKEIHSQQQRNSAGANVGMNMDDLPLPSVREYILRNQNVKNPCQLTACMGGTFGLENGGTNSTRGGLVLAIKKSVK